MKTKEYRIITDGLVWQLQQKVSCWFFTWWFTIYLDLDETKVFEKGYDLQDEQLKQE